MPGSRRLSPLMHGVIYEIWQTTEHAAIGSPQNDIVRNQLAWFSKHKNWPRDSTDAFDALYVTQYKLGRRQPLGETAVD